MIFSKDSYSNKMHVVHSDYIDVPHCSLKQVNIVAFRRLSLELYDGGIAACTTESSGHRTDDDKGIAITTRKLNGYVRI